MATVSEGLPGDNPVYGVCEVEPTEPRSHSVSDVNGIVSSLPYHDFDNPLYGFPESAPMPPPYESVEQGGGATFHDSMDSEARYAVIAKPNEGISPPPDNEDIYDDVETNHSHT